MLYRQAGMDSMSFLSVTMQLALNQSTCHGQLQMNSAGMVTMR